MKPILPCLDNTTRLLLPVLLMLAAWTAPLQAQETPPGGVTTNRGAASPSGPRTNDPIARIRDEGLNRSQVMETLSYLTDVIGPRLTGSPNLKRAYQWTQDKLTGWGLTNAHLDPWGPFGRGWSLKRFSAQIVEPQAIPLIGSAKAWSPGLDHPIVAEVVFLDASTEPELEKYKGKLKDAIVLVSPLRDISPRFEPLANRLVETNLLRLANAGDPNDTAPRFGTPTERAARPAWATNRAANVGGVLTNLASVLTNVARASTNTGARLVTAASALAFVAREGAALMVSASTQGDGGTFFVAQATLPSAGRGPIPSPNAPRAWSTNAPAIPAQIILAVEDYNRLVRMLRLGEKLKMAVDLQTQFHSEDLMAYNVIAEIPGTDLANEVVMLGGHLDSWHSGTGATDNGAGVAAAMEAVRILKALDLHLRRTVRIGLWSGEEEGLLGSHAYVANHLGSYTNLSGSTNAATGRGGRGRNNRGSSGAPDAATPATNSSRRLVFQPEFEKFSVYFNLDNGAGKIRGVYLQGNEAARPIFRRWLRSFADLGADTISLSNTGGTDHQSFDAIGLPAFQFIQDPIDYWTRTHHSNEDVFDRVPAEDMKQAATVMAAFVYNAAMMEEKLPRKPRE